VQGFSGLFAGVPPDEITDVPPIFVILIEMLNLEILADSGHELGNIASK
jgi:hypothetical protein